MSDQNGSTVKRGARRAFAVGSWLLFLAILGQFLLARLEIFASGGFLSYHASIGAAVVAALALLLVVAGWIGRAPGGTVGLAASVIGLVVLQSLLLFPYHLDLQGPARAVSGLHVLNAVLIFWVGTRLVVRGRQLRPPSRTAGEAAGGAA